MLLKLYNMSYSCTYLWFKNPPWFLLQLLYKICVQRLTPTSRVDLNYIFVSPNPVIVIFYFTSVSGWPLLCFLDVSWPLQYEKSSLPFPFVCLSVCPSVCLVSLSIYIRHVISETAVSIVVKFCM